MTSIHQLHDQLSKSFTINGWTLVSPFLVILLALRKVATLPALVIGALTGILTILIVQSHTSGSAIFSMLQNGYKADTGVQAIDEVVNRGMMWSISLIWISLALGGLVRSLGMLDSFMGVLKKREMGIGSEIQ